jgi:hypothetical protein
MDCMLCGLLDVSSIMAGSNSRNIQEKQYKHKTLCAVVGEIKVQVVERRLHRTFIILSITDPISPPDKLLY